MTINDLVTPVVLEYLEPDVTQKTIDCLLNAGFYDTSILVAQREGVGSMSKAFNSIFIGLEGYDIIKTPFIWFVTNVSFTNQLPSRLLGQLMSNPKLAAVHPSFNSDHPWMRTQQSVLGPTPAALPSQEIPFIELTAPMFRLEALAQVGLMDEKMPYWGMDADWGFRARKLGWELGVSPYRIDHTYLHQSQPHAISKVRQALRSLYDESTRARLVEKYGPDWKTKICPGGAC